MFTRRGAGLLLRRLHAHGCSVAEGPVDGIGLQFAEGSGFVQSIRGCLSPIAAAVYTTGSFWDVPSSGAKEALYVELQTTRGMLPHRGNFSAQFHPHGVQLMPAGLRLRNMALQEAWEGDDQCADVPVMADSVKRKRRVKIKKHKYKKRMKKLRHQVR
jgi:hypothetical protein